MPINVTLIVGPDGTGKSTLARCLSGIGRGWFVHPSFVNVADLKWDAKEAAEQTLCLLSSLNEGARYVNNGRPYQPGRGRYTVAPWHLGQLLDLYCRSPGFECKHAVLCINTNVADPGWTVADYERAAEIQVTAGTHNFINIISMGGADLMSIKGARNLRSAVAPAARNEVAADVRTAIGLR